jgi:hypothetical protein
MLHSTDPAAAVSIALSPEQIAVLAPLSGLLAAIAQRLLSFRAAIVSPLSTRDLEADLALLTRELGRLCLESTLNSLEPDLPEQVPDEIRLGGTRYRRRFKSPTSIGSTFGTLRLSRWLYEPREFGERCLFPLEELLGLVAGKATPVLASRVGRLLGLHTQREALRLLHEDNGLKWSHDLLRKVGASVDGILSPERQTVQAEQLIDWLRQAYRGRGKFDPVLAVGRDGIMVPICGRGNCQEVSVGTLCVYDRKGRRMGTIYLAQMPEPLQKTLSEQLTGLLQAVLAGWKGQRPRLVYITDGGQTQQTYYDGVLRKMADPRRRRERLVWLRVVDYYHACQYISKLAEALFGQKGQWWARQMRRVLKQAAGVTRLLQSASYYANKQELSGERRKEFTGAYNYLWKRRKEMAYAGYKAAGMPIGSGVTEAGCKVVVTQRLKLSGMKWKEEGGQVVLNLRVLWLGGVWQAAWDRHISVNVNPPLVTYEAFLHPTLAVSA